MAAPAARVFAGSQPPRLSGIEDSFNPSAQPRCRLRHGLPDRLEDLQNMSCIDGANGHVSDDRVGISSKRVAPLLSMLWISPGALV